MFNYYFPRSFQATAAAAIHIFFSDIHVYTEKKTSFWFNEIFPFTIMHTHKQSAVGDGGRI